MSHTEHPEDCRCGACSGPIHALKPDAIIEGLDPDMCGPEGLTVMRGYLADGTVDGVWRLYSGLALDEYFLLRERDIVSQRQTGAGSTVWVRADARIRYVRIGRPAEFGSPPPAGAAFLDGPISRRRREIASGALDAAGIADDPAFDDTFTGPCPASAPGRYTKASCCSC